MRGQTEYGIKKVMVKGFLSIIQCCPKTEPWRPCSDCSEKIRVFIAMARKLISRAYPDGMPPENSTEYYFDPDFAKNLEFRHLVNDANGFGVIFFDKNFNRSVIYQIPNAQAQKIILGENPTIEEEGGGLV